MLLTENQNNTLQLVVELSSILSVIGSGSIILSNIFTGNIFGRNKFWNRIIFFMSFWDLCGSSNLLLKLPSFSPESSFCKYQGLTTHFFFLNSIFWTAAIAFSMYFIAVLDKKTIDIQRYEYVFHIVIMSLSIVLTLPLYIMENSSSNTTIFGDATLWCWITKDYGKYRMIFFYIPLWIVFFFNASIYVILEIICRKRGINSINNNSIYYKNSIVKRSDLYLLVFFITWIWGTVNRINNNINNENNPIFILYLLHALFTPLQGFLNSLVYFWSSVAEHTVELRNMKNQSMNHHDINIEKDSNYNFNMFMKTKQSIEEINKFYNSKECNIQISSQGDDETITNDKSFSLENLNTMENKCYLYGLPVSPTSSKSHSDDLFNYDISDDDEEDRNTNVKHFSFSIVGSRKNSFNITISDTPDSVV